MGKTSPTLVVADAGPLIHLDELDALDVLSDFKAILVPNTVWLEVQHHRPRALEHKKINLLRQATPPAIEQIKALATLYTLHHGERDALAQCLTNNINLLVTDDTAARLAAKSLNIAAHGTIGLLIRSVRQELRTVSDVLTLLTAIPEKTTLHIRPSLLNDVIAQVKTEWKSNSKL
jgi:predicted nucleic acid-binding protein